MRAKRARSRKRPIQPSLNLRGTAPVPDPPTERLHLSEAEACLRIAAARASREHPVVLEMLADGRLHLSAIGKIAPHLTLENRGELLRRATHRTKREIAELVAELAPRPDVPASVRKLPTGRFVPRPASARSPDPMGAIRGGLDLVPRPEQVDPDHSDASRACSATPPVGQAADLARCQDGRASSVVDARPEAGRESGLRWITALPPRPAVVEPLAPTRYKVQFTASAELREKLERLQALMRPSVPDGGLAAIIEAAVTEKLERLEARHFGRTKSPRKTVSETDTSPRTRGVPAAVKRAVGERDEHRCRYVDTQGNRCTARARLEYHHRHTFALGGDHSPRNISLLCQVHNRLLAEIDYGREAVSRHRSSGSGSSAVVPPHPNTAGSVWTPVDLEKVPTALRAFVRAFRTAPRTVGATGPDARRARRAG